MIYHSKYDADLFMFKKVLGAGAKLFLGFLGFAFGAAEFVLDIISI